MKTSVFANAAVVLPCLLLAACQVTTFETPPLAAAGACDTALVGVWDSVDPDAAPGSEAEMTMTVAADCDVRWVERHAGRADESGRMSVQVGRYGDFAYAWADARRALATTAEGERFPRGDVIVVRYRIDGETLQVWNTDDKAIAHAIVDGALTGQLETDGNDIFNRLTGTQEPAVLERDGFWDAQVGTLRRRADD